MPLWVESTIRHGRKRHLFIVYSTRGRNGIKKYENFIICILDCRTGSSRNVFWWNHTHDCSHLRVVSGLQQREELVEYSEMVMHGTLVDSSSYVEWHVSGNAAVPSVYTVWSLQQSESIKGPDFKTVDFVVNGGTYNNIVHESMHDTELNKGDDVIVFLTKDTDSIYKDH